MGAPMSLLVVTSNSAHANLYDHQRRNLLLLLLLLLSTVKHFTLFACKVMEEKFERPN
jgi:hypothetical protein